MPINAFSRRAAIAALAAASLAACGSADGENATAADAPPPAPASGLSEYDRVMGDPDAPVTLIEYASTTCPHCATFHAEVLPTIKADYVDAGKVRYVFRDFPTAPPQIAVAGFAIARCSGDQYYNVLDDLMENQAGILSAAREGQAKSALFAVAQRHGFKDEAALDECLNDTSIRRQIAAVVQLGEDAGVTGTPTLFLDGRKLERSEPWHTAEGLSGIIDAALGEDQPEAAETDDAGTEATETATPVEGEDAEAAEDAQTE